MNKDNVLSIYNKQDISLSPLFRKLRHNPSNQNENKNGDNKIGDEFQMVKKKNSGNIVYNNMQQKRRIDEQTINNLRKKVMLQILQKNRINEQLEQIREQFNNLQRQCRQMGNRLNQLNEQYNMKQTQLQKIMTKCQSYKYKNKILIQTNNKITSQNQYQKQQISKLKSKLAETQKYYKQQKKISQTFKQQNKILNHKLYTFQCKIKQLQDINMNQKNKFYLDQDHQAVIINKNAHIQKLTAEINKLTSKLKDLEKQLIQIKSKNIKQNSPIQNNKIKYDQTRMLIQKLQQAEMQTRLKKTEDHNKKIESPTKNNWASPSLQYSPMYKNSRYKQFSPNTWVIPDLRKY